MGYIGHSRGLPAFPALHHANLNDFHEVFLLSPLLGFALHARLRGRRRVMFTLLALCLPVKEDVTVTVLAFSLFIIRLQPCGFRRRDGVALALYLPAVPAEEAP